MISAGPSSEREVYCVWWSLVMKAPEYDLKTPGAEAGSWLAQEFATNMKENHKICSHKAVF